LLTEKASAVVKYWKCEIKKKTLLSSQGETSSPSVSQVFSYQLLVAFKTNLPPYWKEKVIIV